MPKVLFALLLGCSFLSTATAADPSRILNEGEVLKDARLGPLRTLNDRYHSWTPPETKEDWEREAEAVRVQLLVSNGLWPMPPKTPLNPVIHGTVERDGYIIQRVFFESLPGHYVTGSIFRPAQLDGKAPGVLCPHGHWANSRFYDAGETEAQKLIDGGGEKYLSGARHHIQARMVHLAKMGCVVFHYDMVGYSDSTQIGHREGFTDVQAGLWLQNAMGLQTWNSIRALDFLCSLPEVDTTRIGVTGASGGGTQTFMLCALDPRPTVAFPAVMVSTAMQGGCICENADYLRVGINNVTIAALFAPKPMALSGANDWTIDIETKGYPELQQIYGLYGERDKVYAKCYPQFGHNYNYVSRRMMYEWFKTHLGLPDDAPVEEADFHPASRAELTVFDAEHPLPGNATDAAGVRKYLTEVQTQQFVELLPEEADDMQEYRRVIGSATRLFFGTHHSSLDELNVEIRANEKLDEETQLIKGTIERKATGANIPFLILTREHGEGRSVVIWADDKGKASLFGEEGSLRAEIKKLLDGGHAVIAFDPFLTGELIGAESTDRLPVNEQYSGYTYGYNKPTLANRVLDVMEVAAGTKAGRVILVGTGQAGLWTLLARGQLDDRIALTIVNLDGFSFSKINSTSDPNFLPGALRYGGVGGLAALAAPHALVIGGWREIPEWERSGLARSYQATQGKLQTQEENFTREQIVEMILGR